MAEVLQAINASTGDFSAVFHLILTRATSLCDAPSGGLVSVANDHAMALAMYGMPQALVDYWSTPQYIDPNTGMAKVLRLGKTLHQPDMAASEMYRGRVPMSVAGVELGGIRSFIMVPLVNERGVMGLFVLYRPEVRPFSDRQIALVEAFAAQAAVAMENARLLTEQREALEQQTATAEVLGVINSSPGNLAPVFDAVLDKARRLCDAAYGDLWTYDGAFLHLAATQGEPAFAAWLRAQGPVPVWPGAPAERLLRGADHVQYEDPVRDGNFAAVPEFSAQVERAGVRSILFVPMKKDGALVGVVIVYRREVRRFTDRQIAVLQGFAAQAVIAMENARLITGQREALEQQTATAEVLEVINASPGNLEPVFDAMLEKAMRLCAAAFGIFGRFDGKLFEPVVDRGVPAELIATTRQIQSPPPNSGLGRLSAGESVVQLVDLANTDVYRQGFVGARALVDIGGAKTAIFVALRKDGELRGVLVMYRREVRAFTDKQVALLQSFAAQAVIAMENARLLTEQREALEQQTATADILRVISQSPTDVQPVLEAVVKAAVRFCGAEDAIIALRDGDHWEGVAHEGPLGAPIQRALPLNRDAAPGRSILDAETIQYPDIEALDPAEHAFEQYAARRMGFKAVASAPMLRDHMAIGAVALRRTEPGPFTARQIELLESFAAQAVIAIENVRLFTELRESLDQQTATADILRVISQSPTDVQPVLDVVAEAAQRFCGAADVVISLREGDELRIAAHAGPMRVPSARRKLDRSSSQGRAIVDARVVHTADFTQLDPAEWSKALELSREFGFNSAVAAPMLRDGAAIGTIFLRRPETGPFAPRQIALLEAFAAQAVIAIENVRLFTELREALDQQTATAEVLEIINRSQGDLHPVFDTIVAKAMALCDAAFGMFNTFDGERFHTVATRGIPQAYARYRAENPPDYGPETAPGRLITGEDVIQVADMADSDLYRNGDPNRRSIVDLGGARTILNLALRREGKLLGMIAIYRQEVKPFTEQQIALVQGFATQAVIAMENARLLSELRESLDQQTATADILRVISQSPTDVAPVLDAVAKAALRFCTAEDVVITLREGDHWLIAGHEGPMPASIGTLHPLNRQTSPSWAILDAKTIHLPDITTLDPLEYAAAHDFSRRQGFKAAVAAPMLREGQAVGAIALRRAAAGAFTPRQIELLESFAAQAVIALENTRLFTELRQRTDDLTESLEYQTATSELLEVISRSSSDIQPVFDTMLASAARLCGVEKGDVAIQQGEVFRHVAFVGCDPEELAWLKARVTVPGRGTSTARALLERRVDHVLDQSLDPERVAPKVATRPRTTLAVPLMRDGEPLGVISLLRDHVEPFSERQIALIETFADQAVIAMENARLLSELTQRTDDLAESLDYQTATSEVLGVISRSPTTLQPVLEAMTAAAVRLCGVKTGGLSVRRGDRLQFVALVGQTPEFERWQMSAPIPVARGVPLGDAILDKAPVQIVDVMETEAYKAGAEVERAVADIGGHRTLLHVPLLREDEAIGVLTVSRGEPLAFTERQIGLIETFADQAVIAMENARLLSELRESLDQQTATAEILQVINTSPGDLTPVFRAILEKAHSSCGADMGSLFTWDGTHVRAVVTMGYNADIDAILRQPHVPPDWATDLVAGQRFYHRAYEQDRASEGSHSFGPAFLAGSRIRTNLIIPLRKDDAVLGFISANRREVRPYSDKEIALLENFAAQAVIAMENARLLGELTRREEELRVTFDHMGDGVVMFDADLKLAAWNRNFQELLDIPDTFLAPRPGLEDYVRLLVERGELGHDNPDEEIDRYRERANQPWSAERTRPDGRTLEVRNNPVPGGGAVLIYSDITERKKAEAEIRAARDAAEAALDKLKAAQANLVQSEKMASLGQLTAGIAHEIKNPLNFVNNFATLSVDLLDELKEVAGPALAALDEDKRAEVDETMELLTGNLGKIAEHGKRADGIVKSMLSHSRGGTGDWAPSDINALVEEALNLAYHGARAQDKEFNVTLERDFEKASKPIEVVPQDVTRVFLNLFGNGFYATNKRRLGAREAGFRPTLTVTTRETGDGVEVKVRDNGTGIPPEVREKLFQPFFTTKPTGEGTGLGLSISYDIVTQQHGGTIGVESEVGKFTEFTVRLPRSRRVVPAEKV